MSSQKTLTAYSALNLGLSKHVELNDLKFEIGTYDQNHVSYHKYVDENWAEGEFAGLEIYKFPIFVNGNLSTRMNISWYSCYEDLEIGVLLQPLGLSHYEIRRKVSQYAPVAELYDVIEDALKELLQTDGYSPTKLHFMDVLYYDIANNIALQFLNKAEIKNPVEMKKLMNDPSHIDFCTTILAYDREELANAISKRGCLAPDEMIHHMAQFIEVQMLEFIDDNFNMFENIFETNVKNDERRHNVILLTELLYRAIKDKVKR